MRFLWIKIKIQRNMSVMHVKINWRLVFVPSKPTKPTRQTKRAKCENEIFRIKSKSLQTPSNLWGRDDRGASPLMHREWLALYSEKGGMTIRQYIGTKDEETLQHSYIRPVGWRDLPTFHRLSWGWTPSEGPWASLNQIRMASAREVSFGSGGEALRVLIHP